MRDDVTQALHGNISCNRLGRWLLESVGLVSSVTKTTQCQGYSSYNSYNLITLKLWCGTGCVSASSEWDCRSGKWASREVVGLASACSSVVPSARFECRETNSAEHKKAENSQRYMEVCFVFVRGVPCRALQQEIGGWCREPRATKDGLKLDQLSNVGSVQQSTV